MKWPHLDFLMSNHRDEDHVVIFWQICLHRNLIKYGSMKNAWAKHVTFSWTAWFLLTQVSVISNTVEWDYLFLQEWCGLVTQEKLCHFASACNRNCVGLHIRYSKLIGWEKKAHRESFRLVVSHKQFWLQKFVSLKKKQISNIFDNFFILSYFDNLSFFIGPPVKAGYVFLWLSWGKAWCIVCMVMVYRRQSRC